MQRTIKFSGILFLILFFAFLIYSLTPRVAYTSSPYGVSLADSEVLTTEEVNTMKTYITDTAHNEPTVVIIHNEKMVLAVGDTEKLMNAHSIRKSIMSLLIGIALERGLLRLDETLHELGTDESKTPLTALEKTATIRDLLMARSGIYLPAEAETSYATQNRPEREQFKPGEYYFYNNVDFNLLGSILELKTEQPIGEFMQEHLAQPLGLQDFSASNVVYNSPWPVPNKTQSDYPVYWIFISARDLAKIGAMVSQKGKWMGNQIVSERWIEESTQPYSSLDKRKEPYDAYAYSWFVDQDEQTIWSDGFGGQYLLIDPRLNISIAQRTFTGNSLLSSGLFFMKKDRDGWRTDVMYLHTTLKRLFNQKNLDTTHD